VARISPDGIVSWGDDLSRASGGSLEKVAEGKYSLKLFSARPSDSGVYRCVVSVYAGRRNPGLSTPATLTQRSEGVTVNLKTKGEPHVLGEVKASVVLSVWDCVDFSRLGISYLNNFASSFQDMKMLVTSACIIHSDSDASDRAVDFSFCSLGPSVFVSSSYYVSYPFCEELRRNAAMGPADAMKSTH